MSFSEAIRHCLSNYASFSGRAPRSEYWWFTLFYVLVLVGTTLIFSLLFGPESAITNIVYLIAALALLLPSLGVTVRRLHDTDRRGWWVLISLVPFVGALIMLYFLVSKGTDGPNRFGDDPLG